MVNFIVYWKIDYLDIKIGALCAMRSILIMNDFTKDELTIIALELEKSVLKYQGIIKPSPFLLDLKHKIESMIDNYCEHQGEIITDSALVEICTDCGKYL